MPIDGSTAIPEFAGTRQRVAQVIIENDARRPLRILDARGYHWTFDDAGRIDEDLRNTLIERMDAFDKAERGKRMRVVDLVPAIKKRELLAKLEWTLTAEDLDRIAADIWPGIHGPAPEVSTVKGKAPRKPPLTNDALSTSRFIAGETRRRSLVVRLQMTSKVTIGSTAPGVKARFGRTCSSAPHAADASICGPRPFVHRDSDALRDWRRRPVLPL